VPTPRHGALQVAGVVRFSCDTHTRSAIQPFTVSIRELIRALIRDLPAPLRCGTSSIQCGAAHPLVLLTVIEEGRTVLLGDHVARGWGMMVENAIQMKAMLSESGADANRLEGLTTKDVLVDRPRAPTPAGAKAGEAFAVGALLISVAGSGTATLVAESLIRCFRRIEGRHVVSL
jgi:hypothetical protein